MFAIFRNPDMVWKARTDELESVLDSLSEREQKVLKLRFQEKMTLQNCVPIIGISRERVRQIEAKALRLLRHPARIRKLQTISKAEHYEVIKAKDEKYEELALEYENLKKAYLAGVQPEEFSEFTTGMVEKARLLNTEIEELGFSYRSYNCLKRANINTVEDIINITFKDLNKIRNLGKKSQVEILDALESHGLKLKEED